MLCRFGNGCFLHCLETVYQKLTGHKLEYSGLVGKPSTVTYIYSHNLLLSEARRIGVHDIRRIYCIGYVTLTVYYIGYVTLAVYHIGCMLW